MRAAHDPGGGLGRALARRRRHQVRGRDRRHVDDKVEAIDERTGEAAEILRHAPLVGRALAGVARLVGHPAPARIHRRDQLKPGRIDDAMIGPRDRDFPGLERLTQAVEDLGLKLRQFVEEQDAVVGERDLAGLGMDAAADQSRHGGRVVGAAERAPVGQRPAGERPGDRMDHRHFEQFARGQRRQDRRQPLGEHRLSRPRRAAHQQVVAPGGGDLERPLGALLPLDVAQVRLRPARARARPVRAGRAPGRP